jgi:hypothetical protein
MHCTVGMQCRVAELLHATAPPRRSQRQPAGLRAVQDSFGNPCVLDLSGACQAHVYSVALHAAGGRGQAPCVTVRRQHSHVAAATASAAAPEMGNKGCLGLHLYTVLGSGSAGTPPRCCQHLPAATESLVPSRRNLGYWQSAYPWG